MSDNTGKRWFLTWFAHGQTQEWEITGIDVSQLFSVWCDANDHQNPRLLNLYRPNGLLSIWVKPGQAIQIHSDP